ncbi:anti-sigma factor RsiW [Buttiauxella sp. BIGb0471]|uniref:anti-sigma factor family protein n=1 Tax=Buttiauxella sp. BIGb0471 TaxID=2940597 RepID=UPI00216AA91D|nr:anti-sigma factor [Buttiauxella sp. BIGb0471]MCS3604212.1 anti-sigma factor RsiW [Buttiauxella sp. BIGb0471]
MRLHLGSDEMLVAYLDNELSETQRKVLESRLAKDNALAQRLALLERSNLPFKAAFEPLLELAPDEQLQQQFSPEVRKNHNVSRRNLIAAAVSLLALGVIGDRAFLHFSQPEENWRELVAQYMALYTPETLAETPTPQALDAQLKVTETQLGVTLAAASLALPNATLKNARVLAYEDRRIAQITWLESSGPLALCITRQTGNAIDTQSEQRLDMNIVYWASQSHQFMVIGHETPAKMSEIAERLQHGIGT